MVGQQLGGLDDEWGAPIAAGPNVIGCSGGSGSRVVAGVIRRAGVFIGTHLAPSLDALHLRPFLDRWVSPYWIYWASTVPSAMEADMVADLRNALRLHCSDYEDSGRQWGWKAPRSMYLLPFLAERFPSLRFLHLVRDGRDMAFAKTQGGIRKHGTAILGKDERALRRPLRSAALWSSVNVAVASYGDEHMAERYLRIRFEDLCERPASTTADILRFFRLSGDAEALATAVDLPNSVGRWRSGERSVIDELERLAEPGLVRFGYITSRTAAG